MNQQQFVEAYEVAKPWLPAIALALVGLWLLRSGLIKRVVDMIFAAFTSHWQLALLGTAALTLSAASGWTTWDGMTNFTGEPVLSAMITFGIQGIMLIIAWLIGESFATGMSHVPGSRNSKGFAAASVAIGFLALALVVGSGLVYAANNEIPPQTLTWALAATGAAIIAVLLIHNFSGSDILHPYIQATRIIAKNAMLWVMFLACMGTAVFFSFDSRFNAVFPANERVRAAEFRAQSQVGGLIADIDQAIQARTSAEAGSLFQNPNWQAFEKQMAGIARISSEADGAIERYMNEQIEARARAINEQQERMSSAQSGQAGLAQKKISLTEEKSRLVAERPGLAAEYAGKKSDLDAKARDVDAKRVEALAEGKGVEGTGKTGRGPQYRARMAELSKLQEIYKIAEERTKDAQKRLDTTETRLAQIDRELATIDGDLAKLKGEADTAEQRIKLANQTVEGESAGAKLDPARLVPAFERAQAEFREKPSTEQLGKLQAYCGDIYGALSGTPETKQQLGSLDCDSKIASDAAAALFAVQAGAKVFNETCVGGDKLTANKGVDSLFTFARKCLADAGLPSADTDSLREKINAAELNRDDKAHRFVVSWNAFHDGNRLAYLALAISIGIEALIFMSGLFGASAVRSPLSDVPSFKARSAAQLEDVIDAALGTSPHETASLFLTSLRPITNTDGFSAIAALDSLDPSSAARVRQVLTAGADIGAVQLRQMGARPGSEAYVVRGELREYLSGVVAKQLKKDGRFADGQKLYEAIRDAVAPHYRENADAVMRQLEPINEVEGYTSIVTLSEIGSPYDRDVTRRVVIAGTPFDCVRRDKVVQDRFLIRPDLSAALSKLRVNEAPSESFHREWTPEAVIRAALAPEPKTNADIVLRFAKPIRKIDGFGFEVELSPERDLSEEETVLQRVMSAAATLGLAEPEDDTLPQILEIGQKRSLFRKPERTDVVAAAPVPVPQSPRQRIKMKTELYDILLRVRASSNYVAPARSYIDGGMLRSEFSQIGPGDRMPAQKSLTARPEATREEFIKWQSRFLTELSKAIDVSPDVVEHILNDEAAEGVLIGAWKALKANAAKSRQQGNSLLSNLLSDFEGDHAERLSEAASELRNQLAGDKRKLDVLDRVESQIEQRLPALLVLPDKQLLPMLDAKLVEAAADDTGDDTASQELREQLNAVKRRIAQNFTV